MKRIVIIGAGGFAREVKFLIDDINQSKKTYEFLGYIVSDITKLGDLDSKDEVLGDFTWFDGNEDEISIAIGIGNPKLRLKLGNELINKYKSISFPPLIDPNVIFDKSSCVIDEGVIICSSTIMTVNVRVKKFALLNLNCTVGHEAVIGEGSVINPTVNISGGVNIGSMVLVVTGAQLLQYINIGDNTIIGAGACLTKSVPENEIWGGVPAKPLRMR